MSDFNIVYTGSFTFPEGFAGTKRVKSIMTRHSFSAKVFLLKKNKIRKGISDNIEFYYMFDEANTYMFILSFVPNVLIGLYKFYSIFCDKEKKNVLYVYSGINIENFFLVLFAKTIGFKVIVDMTEDFGLSNEKVSKWRSIKNRSNIFLNNYLRVFADGIVVISKYLENKYKENKYLPTLYLPISAPNINVKDNFDLDNLSQSIKILYSGTYGVKDGIEQIISTIKNVIDKGFNVSLILTGNPSSSVLNKIWSLRLEQNIILTGYLSDAEYYSTISSSDILLMTRINSAYANASFPFKLGEYLASGNPVIATRISDVELYLEDHISAYLIEPEDYSALEKAIIEIIKNPESSKKIGQRGLEVAKKIFNPDDHVLKLEGFVNDLFQGD